MTMRPHPRLRAVRSLSASAAAVLSGCGVCNWWTPSGPPNTPSKEGTEKVKKP